MRQLLSHVQRVLAVLFGYASCFVKQIEDRLSCFVELKPPRVEGLRYVGFVDPSGGSSDRMTLAIAHLGGQRVVLDLIRERRPPFSPDDVVNEFSALLKAYGVGTVRGDRYGGLWPRERFAVHGVEYLTADKPKSDLYRDLLPALNSGRVELLDHARLVAQLCGLERRTARGGRESIDHAPGAHDDVANSVAGAIVTAVRAVDYNAMTFYPAIIVSNGPRRIPAGGAEPRPLTDWSVPRSW